MKRYKIYSRNNESGFVGVRMRKLRDGATYDALVNIDGRIYSVGTFADAGEAAEARRKFLAIFFPQQ